MTEAERRVVVAAAQLRMDRAQRTLNDVNATLVQVEREWDAARRALEAAKAITPSSRNPMEE